MSVQKFLLATFLFTLGLFFIPAGFFSGKRLKEFSFIWSLAGELKEAEESPSRDKAKKLFKLLAYKKEEVTFLLESAKAPKNFNLNSITQAQHFSVPLFGDGYFAYNKLGKDIRYYSSQGEELWQKEYPYYPVSDHYGNLILLLAGDSSRVYFMNRNGFLMGKKNVSGAYLSDYDFASRLSASALIFSSGELYLIQSKGKIVFKHKFSREGKNVFLKSCALSPRGQLLAVHLLKDKKDMLVVLKADSGQRAEVVYETPLPKVYPHLLHMALNSHGVLIAAPDQTLFLSLTGKKNWTKALTCKQDCPTYRPVYADENFFAFGSGKKWTLVDQGGPILFQASLAPTIKEPWRFLAAKKTGILGIHAGTYLEYYRYGL